MYNKQYSGYSYLIEEIKVFNIQHLLSIYSPTYNVLCIQYKQFDYFIQK